MENNDVLEQVCGLRRSFDDLISRHSGDRAFADSVKSAIDEAGFPLEAQLRKEFVKDVDSARILRISIFGAAGAGKTTLLNSLFFGGKAVLPEASTPWTAPLVEITWGNELTVTIGSLLTEQDIAELKKKSDDAELRADFSAEIKSCSHSKYVRIKRTDDLGSVNAPLQMVKEQHYDRKNTGSESFKVGSVEEIAERLHAYVGSDGKFRPSICKVSITLPDENLKGLSVTEIPRYDALIPSRDEQAQFALRECDAVFVLEPGEPSFFFHPHADIADLKLISGIIKKNGLREIYSVLSKSDKTLVKTFFGWGNIGDCSDDIDAAIDKVTEERRESISSAFESINQNSEFDQFVNEASDRVFLISGICEEMAQTFEDRKRWNSEKKHVWEQLCDSYPKFFSDVYEDTSFVCLEKLGNTEKILGRIEDLKARKTVAFKDSIEQFVSRYSDLTMEARDYILHDIKVLEDEIRSNDLDGTESEIKLLKESYSSIAPKIDAVSLETVNTWHNAVLSDYKNVLSGPYQDVTSAMQNQIGHLVELGLKIAERKHFWNIFGSNSKEEEDVSSKTVTTVNAYGMKSVILDYIEDYNERVTRYYNDQVRMLVTQIRESIQKVWSENTVSSDTPASGFQNRVNVGIQSVIGSEYDLEYKGAQFKYSKYSNSTELKRGLRTVRDKGVGQLDGDDAEDFIIKSRNFVNGLKRGFEKTLHDAIEDVYNKCRSCSFAETVLRPYLKQLEDKKKYMDEPEQALENLRRMEEEVEAIN